MKAPRVIRYALLGIATLAATGCNVADAAVVSPSGQVYVDVTQACGSYAGAKTNGSADVVPVVNCWIGKYPSGATLFFKRGTYKWATALTVSTDGITLLGDGPFATFLDDTALTGNAITVNSVLGFRLIGVTVKATSTRAAGAAILVKGKNHVTATPVEQTRQYTLEDVDMVGQYNGLVINDGSASQGSWNGHVVRGQWTGFAVGGVAVWMNSPNGGQQFISDLQIYNAGPSVLDANRMMAGVRYQGGADFELSNVNQVYSQYGAMLDPPNGQSANVFICRGCLFDSNTRASLYVAPQSGGTVQGVQYASGWLKTEASTSLPSAQIDGGHEILITNSQIWGSYIAVQVQNANGVAVIGNDLSGSTGAGAYFKGTASDFMFINNRVGILAVTPPLGIQIDSGADYYTVTGNNLRQCTTKITNTPGTSAGRRIVQDNIIN